MKAIFWFVVGLVLVICGFALMSAYFPYNLILNIPGGFLVGWNFMGAQKAIKEAKTRR